MTEHTPPAEVLLIGGSSVIAHALAGSYAADGWTVIFGGRDEGELGNTAADVRIRHGTVTRVLRFNATDDASIDAAAESLMAGTLPRDLVFVIGYSDNADRAPYDHAHAERIFAANYG